MFKQSKTQVVLVTSLVGAMIVGHLGYVFHKSQHAPMPPQKGVEVQTSQEEALQCEIQKTVVEKASAPVVPEGKHFQVKNVKELKQVFQTHNYNLKTAKSEGKVPRLYLAKLPKDMRAKQKNPSKSTFIQVVLPLVLQVNREILMERTKLLALQERQRKGGHLRQSEKMWLAKLSSDYRCRSTRIDTLLLHVDAVPPSLALAQGILESGWGTSPAAVHKNSTFGHMKTKKDVESFDNLYRNVKAYVLNLNRHAAYRSFRQERASLRTNKAKLCGHVLAAGLVKYSERGTAYIRDIQNLIRSQDLAGYDHITLDHSQDLQEL